MTVPFAGNSEFREAITLLVDLQFAICEEDEARADTLRDALDIRLNHLSWEANEWLRGLSGDLDMLCDQEVFEPNGLSATEYRSSLLYALLDIENNPEAILALLRKDQSFVSQKASAYFRGRAYSLLGLSQIGVVFLRRAVELDSENIRYKVVLLGSFWFTNDLDQARPLAEAIIKNSIADPNSFLLAAGFLLQILGKTTPIDRVALGKIRRDIEKVVRSLQDLAADPNLVGFGLMLLGVIAEVLNRTTLAQERYSQACLLMPNDETPFLLRERLLYQTASQVQNDPLQLMLQLESRRLLVDSSPLITPLSVAV